MNKGMQRFGAVCSFISMIVFFAGLICAGFFPTLPPSLTPAELTAYYTEHQTGILAGGLIIVLASGFAGPFIGAIFLQLRRMEGPRPIGSFGQLASGIANIQFFIFPGILFVVAAYRPDRPADSLSALNDLAFVVTMLPWTVGAMQCVCIGWAVITHGTKTTPYPRWLGFFNIWIALGMATSSVIPFFKTGPMAWNGLIGFWIPALMFGVWEAVMGVMTLRAVNRDTLEPIVPAGAPSQAAAVSA